MKDKTSSSTLAARAYDEIKSLIRSNRLETGSTVLETELTGMLNMSRTPIHAALVRLSTEGWVQLQSRQGAVINRLSPEDLREIYEMVDGLESIAVQLVAERATEPELEQLKCAVTAMEAALLADDLDVWIKADAEFHRLIRELCGNRRICEMLTQAEEQSKHIRTLTIRLRTKPFESTNQHRAMVEAVGRRDGLGARLIHERHRAQARAELLRIVQAFIIPAVRT